MSRYLFLFLLLLFPGCAVSQPAGSIDLGALFELSAELSGFAPRGLEWDGPGRWAELAKEDGVSVPMAVDLASGARTARVDWPRLRAALLALPEFSAEDLAGGWNASFEFLPAGQGVFVKHRGALFAWSPAAGAAQRLDAPGKVEVPAAAPDGRSVAFVHAGDLHLARFGGGAQQLTYEAAPDRQAGLLDWVYQEEIYGRGNFRGHWWSPDSARLAFLLLDESPVGEFRVEDHRPLHGRQELWRYPKAGDPNPRVEAGVVPAAGGAVTWFDLSAWPVEDRLILQVDWTPDARGVLLQLANRIQNRIDFVLGDPATGAVRVLFGEESSTWLRRSPVLWLSDGGFVVQSPRDGWRHLYRYSAAGALAGALTSGEFEVLAVHGVEPGGAALYAETNEGSILQRHLWRIPLDGGPRTRSTTGRGTHRATIAPDFRHAIVRWSHSGDPGGVNVLELPSGRPVTELARADLAPLLASGWREPEFLQVPARDGFLMEARLHRPAGGGRAPALTHVYGGPHAPVVRDSWEGFRGLWHAALARKGILVWGLDNRTASGKGWRELAAVYRQPGRSELADLEDAVDWLAGRGLADPERLGLWGWSYGGFFVSYALTHSTRFRMGIAGAPVTDWRNYDSVYTERFLDTPQANPAGYESSSVVAAAAQLHGELLLIHGMLDENVHLANTVQLAEALQLAGKPFRMMVYPGNRHGVREPRQRRHLYELMTAFIQETL